MAVQPGATTLPFPYHCHPSTRPLQFISVLVAIVLRLCIYPRENEFEAFEEGGENRLSEAQIQVRRAHGSMW